MRKLDIGTLDTTDVAVQVETIKTILLELIAFEVILKIDS
jgi:hypothetical protein